MSIIRLLRTACCVLVAYVLCMSILGNLLLLGAVQGLQEECGELHRENRSLKKTVTWQHENIAASETEVNLLRSVNRSNDRLIQVQSKFIDTLKDVIVAQEKSNLFQGPPITVKVEPLPASSW